MKKITKEDIMGNSLFFWFYYMLWFRGYDAKKELNMDEALLQVLNINMDKAEEWHKGFFSSDNITYISGYLTEDFSFQIEFHEYEIMFFINDEYIGNLGGHFEAWSLTLDEIEFFQKYDLLFMLLLPMLGITKDEAEYTKSLVSKNLALIPELHANRNYIAECIVNGLIMDGGFYVDPEIGIVNNQNHSIRNIMKYPNHKDSAIGLNEIMSQYVEYPKIK